MTNDFGLAFSPKHGLTKREYFAALAMQGLLANPVEIVQMGYGPDSFAKCAVESADALIEALNKDRSDKQ